MSSSDNLASIETWAFRPPFENSWISEAFARDTEALTKALQKSIASTTPTDVFSPCGGLLNVVNLETPASTVSSSGGSEPESISKRVTRNVALPTRRVAKRKPRASKRSPTTFITADPDNFRQMVQQVTGVRFAAGLVGSVLKPEPQRPAAAVNRLQAGYLLPTLDTSAFLLDHHQQVVGPGGASGGPQVSLGYGPPAVVAEAGGPGLDFDGFSSFPTLDSSWKVM